MFSDYVSEGDSSSATPEPSIHTEALGSQQSGSPASVQPASIPETPMASIQSSSANYTQDFNSVSQSPSRQVCINVPFHSSLKVAEVILGLNIATPKLLIVFKVAESY